MDRFNLEEQLTELLVTKSDLELLYERVLESDISKEDIANVLLGIIHLHNLRFDKTFDTFEYLIEKGVIGSRDV